VGERLDRLNRRIEELLTLRSELGELLSEWDARLAGTPHGERAHLLETLGAKSSIERARRARRQAWRSFSAKM